MSKDAPKQPDHKIKQNTNLSFNFKININKKYAAIKRKFKIYKTMLLFYKNCEQLYLSGALSY